MQQDAIEQAGDAKAEEKRSSERLAVCG